MIKADRKVAPALVLALSVALEAARAGPSCPRASTRRRLPGTLEPVTAHQVKAVEPTRRRSRTGGGLPVLLRHKSLVNLKAAFKLMRHSSYLLAQARHLLLEHCKLFILLLPLQVELAQLRAKRHPHVVK